MDPVLIDRLGDANVLVIGDVLLDRFIEGRVTRISREAPVPVLKYSAARAHPGGACNVAANILATGGAVTLVGLTGDDQPAGELRGLLARFDRLTPRLIADADRQTTVKTRYLSGWQQLLCIDAEDTHAPAPAMRDALVAAALASLPATNAVVISDYGRGALDDDAVRALIAAARAAAKPIIIDPRRADAGVFAGASIVTPNIEEMAAFTGIRVDSDETAVAACRRILEIADIGAVLLTRGSGGMTLVARNDTAPLHVRAETHRVFDVTGAGDTVVATLASALAVGAPLTDAVRLANTAAGIVVAKPGTATALPQELRQALGAARGDGVLSRVEAAEHVRLWQGLGLKVGFTNGVFDLLHRGHLHSLEQARRRVDRLVVGVNADASVKRLKGDGRPVQDEQARAAILASLRNVDLVVIFPEDTPEELIRALAPDCLFKGADYAGTGIPGGAFVKANGGTVEFLPLLSGYSTTGTVAKVRST
ncbi:MAG TPA: PfkB family carbohydrate kinase [Bauldia sp.]|nr:PfkB family carbohydrate kinase [Bauldia sp.]